MSRTRLLRWSAAATAVLALSAVAADASHRGGRDRPPSADRMLVATTDQNQLIRFNARNPERIRDIRTITGLPAGVSLQGIDFRPATGDLYGVGSDSVVYRVNPWTGIAVAEGPAFTPALRGRAFGVDFNPVPDKIRVVSDDRQNLRLNVDEGNVLSVDKDINPGMPAIVGAAYLNSSFSATRPAATTLYVVDAASDRLFKQDPPNDGTLKEGKRLGIDVGMNVGFDIAGAENTGFLANSTRNRGARLYTVDVATGDTDPLGRIGGGRSLGGHRPRRLAGLSGPSRARPGSRRQPCARLIEIPSSTFATVSQASTASSSVSKISFQRIRTSGSMPFANSPATAARPIRSASFSSRWISTRCADDVGAAAQPAQRARDLLGAADEQAGDLLRLLHRRLDAVEPELVGRLLGVVDDVVERARQRVHVGRVEPRAAAAVAGEPVEDVVGDPVALLLAQQDLVRERRLLGVVRQQVAQQQRDALHVAARLLEQAEQLGVGLRLHRPHATRR